MWVGHGEKRISRFPCNGSVSSFSKPPYLLLCFDSEQSLFASLLHGAASHGHLAGTSSTGPRLCY